MTEDEMDEWHHQLNRLDVSLSSLWEMVKDRKPGVLQSVGSQGVRHN